MNLRQPRFTYSAYGKKERIKKRKKQEAQDIFIKTS